MIALRVVAGAADYYNLTVSVLHTYAVGDGQYVVHNCGGGRPTGTEPHTSGPANAAHVDAIFGEGTAAGGGDVTIFRAVDADEFDAMGGQFQIGRSGLKYFTSSKEFAGDFAAKEMVGLKQPFRIMEGSVSINELLQPNVTIGPHPVPGRGWIWEISFEGNPKDTLGFIRNVGEAP